MSDPDFLIESPRLLLSYLQPTSDRDCDFLVALYNTPEFMAGNGGKSSSVVTRDYARTVLEGTFREHHRRNGYGQFLVSLKPSDADGVAGGELGPAERLRAATPIGTVSLMKGQPPNCYAVPDLGFAVLPRYMRKGYATEASLAVMNWARGEKGVTQFLGLHDPANEGSKAVFRKLGFEWRGVKSLKVFGGIEGAVWTWGVDDLKAIGFEEKAP